MSQSFPTHSFETGRADKDGFLEPARPRSFEDQKATTAIPVGGTFFSDAPDKDAFLFARNVNVFDTVEQSFRSGAWERALWSARLV